jgi:hypothetical protein
LAVLSAALLSMASPRGGSAVFPCTCSVDWNTFPASNAQGALTESLSCSPDGGTGCVVTGNIMWEPYVACDASSGPGNWNQTNSISWSGLVSGTQSFDDSCDEGDQHIHSWSASPFLVTVGPCTHPNGPVASLNADIKSNTGAVLLNAAKQFKCSL